MIAPAMRSAVRSPASRLIIRNNIQRRFASSKVPADRRRSWKSFAARWGLAIGGIYYYNTSPYFQGKVHEAYDPHNLPITTIEDENTSLPTIEELAASRRARLASASAGSPDARSSNTLESAAAATPSLEPSTPASSDPSDPGALEEEASQQGAFNEETGEINWDCPCLGGMAHGPCGPEFREAFSCFVFSKEEPKGMDCIDKFKGMQNCFREHPDVYGAELLDDEPEEGAALDGVEGSPAGGAVAGPGGEVAPAPYSGAGGDLEGKLPAEGHTAVPASSPLSLGGDPQASQPQDQKSKTARAREAKQQVKASITEDTSESPLAPRDHVSPSMKKTEK